MQTNHAEVESVLESVLTSFGVLMFDYQIITWNRNRIWKLKNESNRILVSLYLWFPRYLISSSNKEERMKAIVNNSRELRWRSGFHSGADFFWSSQPWPSVALWTKSWNSSEIFHNYEMCFQLSTIPGSWSSFNN